FNRDDLDAVMAYFADDAIYEEFNGRRNVGKAAVREAFVPQFRGDYGKIRFAPEDVFVAPSGEGDPPSGKAMISWRCCLEHGPLRKEWRGLDVLHVEQGRIIEKHTYAKAQVPALRDP